MTPIRRRLDPAQPPCPSPQERDAIEALSAGDIERGAAADLDNAPMTEDELRRIATAQAIRRARRSTGLSQSQFAARYRIGLARLRDWEQGRFQPDSVALAYLRVIEHAPKAVERALDAD